MKESDYILATNKAKVTAALYLMRDVLNGYGITKSEHINILRLLSKAEAEIYLELDNMEDES